MSHQIYFVHTEMDYVPSAGHYFSDRLLQGCREGKWSAVYYHGTPIPIPDRTADASEGKGKEK